MSRVMLVSVAPGSTLRTFLWTGRMVRRYSKRTVGQGTSTSHPERSEDLCIAR